MGSFISFDVINLGWSIADQSVRGMSETWQPLSNQLYIKYAKLDGYTCHYSYTIAAEAEITG